MFSRKSCYFFVRPRTKFLELCVFLRRPVRARQVRRVDQTSKAKFAHFVRITHRDEVEAPVTDWLRQAYDLSAPSDTGTERSSSRSRTVKPKAEGERKSANRRKSKRA